MMIVFEEVNDLYLNIMARDYDRYINTNQSENIVSGL